MYNAKVMAETPKIAQIQKILEELGEKPFRIKQIREYIYHSLAVDFMDMTALSLNLRQVLTEKVGDIISLKLVKEESDGTTKKVLFFNKSHQPIEAVLMQYKGHSTICISTQSGCPLDCKFCATGKMGLGKTLDVDEMCDQILYFSKQNLRPDNVVIMGMGEPLINPDIFELLNVLTSKDYFGYGQRKISISTVGIIPNLKKLNTEFPQVNVAFSMHSPFDEERTNLMPINKVYPLSDVFSVLKEHADLNNRKIFISYILLKGINDTDAHARKLAELIKSIGNKKYLFHVNLIKFHSFKGGEFASPEPDKIRHFSLMLKRLGVSNTVRKDFGEEIRGACGQLAGIDK